MIRLLGIIFCLIVPSFSWAQIAYDAGTAATSGTGTSYTFSHTTTGTNRGLSVCVFMFNSPITTVSSVTYAAVGLTQVGSATLTFGGASTLRLEQWFLANPASGANNVVITPSASTSTIYGFVNSYTGVNQSTPVGTGNNASQVAGNGPVSVNVTSATGEWVSDCVYIDHANAVPTIGAGQTARVGKDDTGVSGNWWGTSTENGATTTTMSWTLGQTGKDWGTVAFPIKPVAAAASTPQRTLTGAGL